MAPFPDWPTPAIPVIASALIHATILMSLTQFLRNRLIQSLPASFLGTTQTIHQPAKFCNIVSSGIQKFS